MNLLRLINSSLAHGYCSNQCLIMIELGLLDLSCNLQTNYAISFLFCLDLILHAYKIFIRRDSFGTCN